jgi:hypothetical protein
VKIKYFGGITYKMKEGHPDIKYVDDWRPDKPYVFKDTYTFDLDKGFWDVEEERISYIKHDLALVAGGGYNTDYITDITYGIWQI